jgi:hypothetical protein
LGCKTVKKLIPKFGFNYLGVSDHSFFVLNANNSLQSYLNHNNIFKILHANMKILFLRLTVTSLFLLTVLSLTFAQHKLAMLSYSILYDDIVDGEKRLVWKNDQEIEFLINNKTAGKYFIKPESKYNFIPAGSESYFALSEYSFGGKLEKTTINLKVFDREFKLTYEHSLEFTYEEKFPLIHLDDFGNLVIFFPSTSELRILNKNFSKSTLLEKNLDFNLERYGFLLISKGEIIAALTNLGSYSKIYFLDSELNLKNLIELDFQYIYRIHKLENNSFLISAYNFEKGLEPTLLLVKNNMVVNIGETLIEDIIGGTSDLLFFSNSIYSLNEYQVIKKHSIKSGSIISGYLFDGQYHLLIRDGTITRYEILSSDFEQLEFFELDQILNVNGFYFSEAEQKLYLKTEGNFISLN